MAMTFEELKLNDQLLEALSYMGFTDATPIQEQAIPVIKQNKDLIACAQTGTGKTAAFLLPILDKLTGRSTKGINTLIIVPTRELAVQIEQQVQGLSYFISVGSIAIYGGGDGKNWEEQKTALKEGTDILVATPGKLISHLKLGYVNIKNLEHLILDEADRMLDMGFIDDLKTIISYLPKKRQTLMFSATMAPEIRSLAKQVMHQPEELSLAIAKPAEGVDQLIYMANDEQKIKLLTHILKERKDYDSVIIFSSTKSKVGEIARSLSRAGSPAKSISSNLEQDQREEVLRKFKAKRIRILVATDVMSRGIDIKEINLVINFDVPQDAADYVHRVGRTARANTTGEAITLVNEKDIRRVHKIEKLIDQPIKKLQPPEELGQGPEWQEYRPPKNRGKNNRRNKKRYYGNKKKRDDKAK
jgi:superfamily II DNA/RNA helicase